MQTSLSFNKPIKTPHMLFGSDNHHYQTFTLDTDVQKDMRIHGRVVASLVVRCFV